MNILNLQKAYNKPEVFINLKSGYYYYNYNILADNVEIPKYLVDSSSEDDELVDAIEYSYILTRIYGRPTVLKCYKEVLMAYTDENGVSLYYLNNLELKDEILNNIKADFEVITKIEHAKKQMLLTIDLYDTSEAVNCFYLNNNPAWLPKDTRVGLMNSITIEINSGKENTTMWFNGTPITVNCLMAIAMLLQLELYALECYNKTAEHKANVDSLNSVEDIINYDYTSGYPMKLMFDV